MFLRTWRFITLILAALDMGMAFCHALELPAKMNYPPSLYVAVQHTLYQAFGTIPGASVEIGAILSAVVLVFLVRKRRPAFQLTLAGALLLSVAFFVVWIMFVAPVNAEIAKWTVESVPPDWTRWRDQWEYSHATRFVLQLIGFGTLVLGLLLEISIDGLHDREA
jgi:hypothetical protein